MLQPGGPSSHCLTSSGLVNASKTSRRGALNTRVIAISRSLGVVTLNVPLFVIADLLYRLVRTLFFALVLRSSFFSSSSRASRRWKLPSQRRRYFSSHPSRAVRGYRRGLLRGVAGIER